MTVSIRDLGIISFQEARQLQEQLHHKVCAGQSRGAILFLEHPPTVSMGARGSSSDVLVSTEFLQEKGVTVCESDRGGLVTIHNPGQLVCYPVINIKQLGVGVRKFVSLLEQMNLFILESYGLKGRVDKQNPGVFIGDAKVASVGIRIDRHVVRHGTALNCDNDLSLFKLINPCGHQNQKMTSISAMTDQKVAMNEVKELARKFWQGYFTS